MRTLLLALTVPLLSGCITLSTFQTPQTLDRGDAVIGAGLTVADQVVDDETEDLDAEEFYVMPEVYARMGLGEGVDAGLKMSGIPPLGLLSGDVKYQFVDGPAVDVAFDLGASYAGGDVVVAGSDTTEYSFVGLYPAIIAGTDRIYGGAKAMVLLTGKGDSDLVTGNMFALFAGAALGDRFKLLPELHAYFGEDGMTMLGGLGLQLGVF